MQVTIGLSRAHYETLRHDVPPEAPGYAILHRFSQLDRWANEKPFSMCVIIECQNPDEAIALLKAAREHCPGAIPDIMYALKTSAALDLIG
jgi:hypothetical protein